MGTFRGRGRRRASSHAPGGSSPAVPSYKLAQVCREVARTLTLALGACDDELLSGLTLVDVEPYPDQARLRVWLSTVGLPAGVEPQVLERLERARPLLRTEVARSLERRRTPDFFFALAAPLDIEE